MKSMGFKDQFGLKLEKNVKGEKKRRGRGRRRRGRRRDQGQQGMETHLVYESYEIMHEFPRFVGYPLAQILGFC